MIYIVLCLLISTVSSQTDVASFGFITSNDIVSGTSAVLRLTLSWKMEEWECLINETRIDAERFYGCSTGINPTATLISNTSSSNKYEMKLELIEHNNLLRIETVRVVDDGSNTYEIDEFCLPPEFSKSGYKGTSLITLECCYWTKKYKYNNYAMGSLKMSYVQFRSNVLNYPNQAHEGLIKPPKIVELGLSTFNSGDAGSTSVYTATLQWDTRQYIWKNILPIQKASSWTTTFNSTQSTYCEFSSGFNLRLDSTLDDELGIDSISVTDESGYTYNMTTFCISNANTIKTWQKYNSLQTQCNDEWSTYTMYDGYYQWGTDATYFIWDKTLFLNAGQQQQGFIANDSHLSRYTCDDVASNNDNTPYKQFVINDDTCDSNDGSWTGGSSFRIGYFSTSECPDGGTDLCLKVEGTQATKRYDNINLYNRITLGADWELYYATGYVRYSFNNVDFSSLGSVYAPSSSSRTYKNQYYNIPDNQLCGHDTLWIQFEGTGSDYCCVDDVILWGHPLETAAPTNTPTMIPSVSPSATTMPSRNPTLNPSNSPSKLPSAFPSRFPSVSPSTPSTTMPSRNPTLNPSNSPSKIPSAFPSKLPTDSASETPSQAPSNPLNVLPSTSPSNLPSISPSKLPSASPSKLPSTSPSKYPADSPIAETPSESPTAISTIAACPEPNTHTCTDGRVVEKYRDDTGKCAFPNCTPDNESNSSNMKTTLSIINILIAFITYFLSV